jgi:hypothetical protein
MPRVVFCDVNQCVPTQFASWRASSTYPNGKPIATSKKRLNSIALSKFPRPQYRSL